MGLPSQITAAALSTLVILGIQMLDALEVFAFDEDQLLAISAFTVAASNLGFGVLLWFVNREHPNPTAPTGPLPPVR